MQPTVSTELKSLVKMMLKKNPKHRPRARRVLGWPYVRLRVNELLSHTVDAKGGGLEAEARRRIRQIAALVQLVDDMPTGDAISLPPDVGRRPPVAAMQLTS